MSDASKPQPITFNDGTTSAYTSPTPMLTGTTATLSAGQPQSASPMSQENVKFVMGPNGQMIAIQKEPFVWKKFFIGLGVPLFLMIIPLILSLYADSMSNWDDDYEYDTIEVDLINGTTYTAAYTLDPSMVIEWCDVSSYNDSVGYNCHHSNDDSEMHIHQYTPTETSLQRENGTTAYSANYTIEEGQSVDYCRLQLWDSDGWYYCEQGDPDNAAGFTIMKETWTDENYYLQVSVGHWNSSSGQIHFDDGEDHGTDMVINIYLDKEIGQWTSETGIFTIDSGGELADGFRITIETMDQEQYDEMEDNRESIDALLAISTLVCCLAPIVAIGMVIYGFAATGGKPVGIGAVVSLLAYPIIAFFATITAMVAGY